MRTKTLLISLLLMLCVPVIVFAKDKGMDVKGLLGYLLTGGGGFLTGIFVLLPLVLKIVSSVKKAQKKTASFVLKWRAEFKNEFERDFRDLLKSWDEVLERVADLFDRLQLHGPARKLRGLITREMFD